MKVVRRSGELREALEELRRSQASLALIPTMGWLHAGHLALFERARQLAAIRVATIFVNPLQFNDPGDYQRYPRNEERDLTLCRQSGIDLLFIPSSEEIYPQGEPALQLTMPSLTQNLCAQDRPGHFEGVMLIVARLLYLFDPDIALFGKKDYQQYLIIKELVKSLGLSVEIVAVDTVREESGLALSSRNAHLSAPAQKSASLIYRALKMGRKVWQEGEREAEELIEIMSDVILSGSHNEIDYLSIVDIESLENIGKIDVNSSFLIATAVVCDGVRLIDNLECRAEEIAK